MSRIVNDFRDEVLSLVKKVQNSHTPLDCSVKQRTAEILSAKYPERSKASIYQMVCYYLRRDKPEQRDSRRTYTKEELQNLYLMNIDDRKKYAEHSGKSYRALYEAITRYHKMELNCLKDVTPPELNCTKEFIDERGYFNFADLIHLKIHQLDHERLIEAKDILRTKYGLSLRAPNILFHKPSGRRYYMKMQEQVAIIANTVKYLAFAADQIKAGWKIVGSNLDPIADNFMNPTYLSVKKFKRPHKDVEFLLAITPRIVESLESITKNKFLVIGTPLYDLLQTLSTQTQASLDAAVPEIEEYESNE